MNLKKQVAEMIDYIRSIMYPEVFGMLGYKSEAALREDTIAAMNIVLDELELNEEGLAKKVYDRIPEIKAVIDTDVQAAYEGDFRATKISEES